MAKIIKNSLGNFLVILLIFSIVTGWIFSGWPQIFNFPPKIPGAQAAITLDASTISEQTACDPCDFSYAVTTSGSDRLLLVAITYTAGSAVTISTVTYAGASMTNVRTDTHATAGKAISSIWYKTDPATGTNTVSVDFSAAVSKFDTIAYTFLSVDQTSPIDAHNGATGTSKTGTVDVTTVATDAWIIDGIFSQEALTMMAKTGRTERMNTVPKPEGGSSTLEATTATTYIMDWTIKKSQDWAMSAVSIKEAEVVNQPPTFSADPNDPREDPDSTCTSPTNDGSTITFRATATDGEEDSWKLLICKADEAPTPSSTDPTCGGTGQWCRDSDFRTQGTQSTCQYVVQDSDYETKDWYAFACDNNAADAKCTVAGHQGGVNSVSPFTVNRRPVFELLSDPGSYDPGGGDVTWSTDVNTKDNDTGGDCTDDTVKLIICKTNDGLNPAGDDCNGGANDRWCYSSLVANNPSCSYTMPGVIPDEIKNAYGYLADQHGFGASDLGTVPQGSLRDFEINNVDPSITDSSIVLKDSDGEGMLIPKNMEAETTGFTVEFIVSDDNSCLTAAAGDEIASAITHVYRSGVLQANCDDDAEDDTDSCYANAHMGTGGSCAQDVSIDSCDGNADPTVGWKCTFPLDYHVDPTFEANTEFESETWMASVKATDDDEGVSSLVEDDNGNEMESFMGYDLVTASIDYSGPLDPGADSTGQITNVEATGNVGIDINGYSEEAYMYTDWPGKTGYTIAIGQQKFDTADDSWDTMSNTLSQNTDNEIELNVPKTKSETVSPPEDADFYWKIRIPDPQETGTYSGENTVIGETGEVADW